MAGVTIWVRFDSQRHHPTTDIEQALDDLAAVTDRLVAAERLIPWLRRDRAL